MPLASYGRRTELEAFRTLLSIDPRVCKQPAKCKFLRFKTEIARLTFMQLVATGSIAALVAAATSRDGVALSCALAASANLIAAIHYRMICESIGTRPFAPKRARLQANKSARACTGTVRQEQADDEAARACDDVAVDNYRYSDWLVRTPELQARQPKLLATRTSRCMFASGHAAHNDA